MKREESSAWARRCRCSGGRRTDDATLVDAQTVRASDQYKAKNIARSREMGGGGGVGPGGGSMDRLSRVTCPRVRNASGWTLCLFAAAMDVARARGMSAWHLQRVLAKKRDPIAHALFLDETTREKGETSDTTDRLRRRPTPRASASRSRSARARERQPSARTPARDSRGTRCWPGTRVPSLSRRRTTVSRRRATRPGGAPGFLRGAPRRF